MKKALFTLVSVFVLIVDLSMTAGCGKFSHNKEHRKDKNTLIVGLDDTFAPMGFRDNKGNLVGFDIDLAHAVGDELGITVKFQSINWNTKEMMLNSGDIDCIWNGLSVTPERKEKMALSSKYLNNKIVFMKLTGSATTVTKAEDLTQLKSGTQADSSALEMLRTSKSYNSFKTKISEYNTYDNAIMDLKCKRVDVVAVDQVLGEYFNKNLRGQMEPCDYSLGDDSYVIGFKKDNAELRDRVNAALKKIVTKGKATEISRTWFGKDLAVYKELS